MFKTIPYLIYSGFLIVVLQIIVNLRRWKLPFFIFGVVLIIYVALSMGISGFIFREGMNTMNNYNKNSVE